MSDWEEEAWNPPPKTASDSAPKQYATQNGADGWDDEPASNTNRGYQSQHNSFGQSNDQQTEQISFAINKSNVGLVIGRGGSKIKELEQRYNVKLEIEKDAEYEATVTIKGALRDANDAKDDILNLTRSGLKRGRDHNENSRTYESQPRSDFTENLEIYPDKVGMVIGRGGSTIKDLQSKFKVRINVNKDTNYDGKCSVAVSGNRDDVTSAIDSIRNLVGEPKFNDHQRNDRAPEPEPMEYEVIDWQAAARESEEENRKRWAALPPLQKNFYDEHPDVSNMTPERVAEIRMENNNITVSRLILDETIEVNEPIPNPIEKFEQCFAAYPDLLDEIKKQGFEKPSPIQAQAWPVLMKGEDLIGIAQTGTGKTLAFLLPAMIHTEYQSIPRSERNGPNVLVLAPTRELALQIEKEVAKYSFRGMKAVCVYGGGDRKAQINNIQSGVEIIIATPGRLNDLVEANVIDVCTITYLILDEADRMLDMGFEPQIRKVLLNIRPDRQTVMTSATWPPGVRRLAQRYMANPVQVCVGTLDLAAVHSVTQVIKIIDEDSKFEEVMNFVKNQMDPEEKAIIFCGKKARADDLSSEFSLAGVSCACMHGNRDQSDREQALLDIKDGVVKILIATDVASRGIDIQDLTYVINYDFPRNIEEYVHRVGRTGRAGRTGKSISYVTRSDWGSAKELINILEEANQDVPDELHNMKERFEKMQEKKEQERQSMGGGGRRFGGGGGGGGGGGRYGGGGGGGGGGRFGGGGGGRSRY